MILPVIPVRVGCVSVPADDGQLNLPSGGQRDYFGRLPSMVEARSAADLGGLCLVDDYRLRRADEVALRAGVVQIWPM